MINRTLDSVLESEKYAGVLFLLNCEEVGNFSFSFKFVYERVNVA
jgi:hypothetical protein